jgi:hypothetical protein
MVIVIFEKSKIKFGTNQPIVVDDNGFLPPLPLKVPQLFSNLFIKHIYKSC